MGFGHMSGFFLPCVKICDSDIADVTLVNEQQK